MLISSGYQLSKVNGVEGICSRNHNAKDEVGVGKH